MRNKRTKQNVKNVFIQYISNNIREYLIVTLIFLIGLILGIVFINNTNDIQKTDITNSINTFTVSIQSDQVVNQTALLRQSIISNIVLAFILWFTGSTVVGMPIVYGIVGFRGFCLGYTISSIIATLGTGKGVVFALSAILLQNIIIIPALLALAVSGIKLYQSIMKDKRKENIKIEICRHTIFCIFMLLLLVVSSFIEVYISSNLVLVFAKYL